MPPFSHNARSALVIAHPGHELRVYGWLEWAQPTVFVLTDGSGRSGHSRIPSTTKILDRTGATPGALYGRFSDREIYAAILNYDVDVFINLVEVLAAELIRADIEYVAGDALEGYNPTHDVCRLVLGAAVEQACRTHSPGIGNFGFSLISQPDETQIQACNEAMVFHLSEAAMARKLASAREYAELSAEVETAFTTESIESFRVECLFPVKNHEMGERFVLEAPFYEQYGTGQVAAGYYRQVIRYHEHILPLAEALFRHVERSRS